MISIGALPGPVKAYNVVQLGDRIFTLKVRQEALQLCEVLLCDRVFELEVPLSTKIPVICQNPARVETALACCPLGDRILVLRMAQPSLRAEAFLIRAPPKGGPRGRGRDAEFTEPGSKLLGAEVVPLKLRGPPISYQWASLSPLGPEEALLSCNSSTRFFLVRVAKASEDQPPALSPGQAGTAGLCAVAEVAVRPSMRVDGGIRVQPCGDGVALVLGGSSADKPTPFVWRLSGQKKGEPPIELGTNNRPALVVRAEARGILPTEFCQSLGSVIFSERFVVIFGGRGDKYTSQLLVYDILTGRCSRSVLKSEVAPVTHTSSESRPKLGPEPRASAAMILCGGMLYILGGWGREAFCDCFAVPLLSVARGIQDAEIRRAFDAAARKAGCSGLNSAWLRMAVDPSAYCPML